MTITNINSSIEPADRLSLVSEYYFSRKLKEVAAMNERGDNIISLAIGSPDLPPSKQTIDTLCSVAHEDTSHGYQPTCGTKELRNAMAAFYHKWYGVELDPSCEIQPLIGSKEGILHITLAFVNPGDEVLVPNPGYPTYTSLSKILGAKVVNYELDENNDWQPNFEALEGMDLSHVKLMWTNYPNMPTGGNAKIDTYEKLVSFAKKHNIVVVNDNPYSFILNNQPISLLQVKEAKDYCIELNSMSKSHNMPGWRIGMCASNPTFISWILKVKSNIDSGTFRGLQLAAVSAYKNDEQWHKQHNIDVYMNRRKFAEKIMEKLECTYDKSQVGMFLWGKIPNIYSNAEELAEKILHEAKVFITPGHIFGSKGNKYIRISLCAKEKQLAEAMERIDNTFNKHK